MMKKYLISYASRGYYSLQDRFMRSIVSNDYSKYYYTDKWLEKQSFYKENIDVFSLKRGAGYWLWKPYIIKDRLMKMKEGDILLYCDVDILCVNDPAPLFELCEDNEILLFQNTTKINKDWTKRDCFVLMDADNDKYYNSLQVNAAIILIKRTVKSIEFVDNWINYAKDIRILTDTKNTMGLKNSDSFVEHRHDQSILGILAKKHLINLFRDPSEYGNPYKVINLRKTGEYLENGYYDNDNIMNNSMYETIFSFDYQDSLKKMSFIRRVLRYVNHFKPFLC